MSGRKRKTGARGRWLWLLGAVLGAVIAYFFVAHHSPGSESIPSPGESLSPRGAEAPREDIRDDERKALDRVLHERTR
jgi:hypothetical protein